jgi:hypothetical protein
VPVGSPSRGREVSVGSPSRGREVPARCPCGWWHDCPPALTWPRSSSEFENWAVTLYFVDFFVQKVNFASLSVGIFSVRYTGSRGGCAGKVRLGGGKFRFSAIFAFFTLLQRGLGHAQNGVGW